MTRELLQEAYQALYAAQVATGHTLYELLHDCEVYDAGDPEPLTTLLERLEAECGFEPPEHGYDDMTADEARFEQNAPSSTDDYLDEIGGGHA